MMRLFLALLLSFVFTLGAMPVLAQTQPFTEGTKVQWLPLLVRDMDRALVLYRDILMFDVVEDRPMEASAFVGGVFNINPTRISRTVKFSAGDEQPRVLALYEVTDLPPVDPMAPFTTGWAVQIDHYDEAYQKLSNGDYRVLGTNAWGSKEEGGGQEIVISDADGHMLIIYGTYE